MTDTTFTELQSDVSAREADLEAATLRIAELQRQANDTTAALSDPDLDVDAIERLISRQAALARAIENATDRYEHVRQTLQQARQRITAKQQRIDDAERLVEIKRNELSIYADSIADHKRKLQQAKDQARSFVGNAEAQLTQAQQRHAAKVAEIEQAEQTLIELRGDA